MEATKKKEKMSVQTTLFGYKVKKEDHIYKDPHSKYEQFVECYYQQNRRNRTAAAKQELVREAEVCLTPYQRSKWFLMAIIALFCVVLKEV